MQKHQVSGETLGVAPLIALHQWHIVSLSWDASLFQRYAALTLIKYQTLPLHISNAGGLEQATAFFF